MSFSDSHDTASGKFECIEWCATSVTKKGEEECGDIHFIREDGDRILFAVIDGLGHGSQAAEASRNAVQTLKTYNDESLISLVNRCHRNLFHTRGVVMSLGLVDCRRRTLSWIGIGNVEGVLLHADPELHHRPENIILRGGVVGYMLPSLQSSMISISEGDLIIFTTDGVLPYYSTDIDISQNTDRIVSHIAGNYFKVTDDALVLAVRINKGV